MRFDHILPIEQDPLLVRQHRRRVGGYQHADAPAVLVDYDVFDLGLVGQVHLLRQIQMRVRLVLTPQVTLSIQIVDKLTRWLLIPRIRCRIIHTTTITQTSLVVKITPTQPGPIVELGHVSLDTATLGLVEGVDGPAGRDGVGGGQVHAVGRVDEGVETDAGGGEQVLGVLRLQLVDVDRVGRAVQADARAWAALFRLALEAVEAVEAAVQLQVV